MANIPTNKALYNRVKSEAKRKFKVYPSAYANAWLVRTYKKRGGGYRVGKKKWAEKVVDYLNGLNKIGLILVQRKKMALLQSVVDQNKKEMPSVNIQNVYL